MKLRSKFITGVAGVLMAGGVLAGTASPVSAATYGMPTATCTSHYGYNHYTRQASLERQVKFVPDVSYDWHHANGFHSETVAYSAALMRHNGSSWVPYNNSLITGIESFNTTSLGDQSRSVSHRGSYAWRVAYVYRPIGSNNWYQLGWNWSNSCYLN